MRVDTLLRQVSEGQTVETLNVNKTRKSIRGEIINMLPNALISKVWNPTVRKVGGVASSRTNIRALRWTLSIKQVFIFLITHTDYGVQRTIYPHHTHFEIFVFFLSRFANWVQSAGGPSSLTCTRINVACSKSIVAQLLMQIRTLNEWSWRGSCKYRGNHKRSDNNI